MARVIKCDVCGKLMPEVDDGTVTEDYHQLEMDRYVQFDVCRDCYPRIMEQIFLRYARKEE